MQCRNTTTITIEVEDCNPQLGSIGDFVWNDLDQDGVQDPGEPGMAGVTVLLKDCSNNILDQTTTDGTGFYLFADLAAGCYRIGVVLPNGFQFSAPNATNDALDSDIDPAMAMSGDINLAPGENDPTNDAGVFQPGPNTGSIGDFVWNDLDQDGVQDPGEPGMAGVTVLLKDCSNNVLTSTVTDANGGYLFSGLAAGCYRIGVVLPNGFQFSAPNATNDALDSDIDPAMAMTGDINLAPGENNPDVDAGVNGQAPPCDNVTNGGLIGFGPNCDGVVEICDANGGFGPVIGDCISPTGGTGAFEIIWIRNPVNCDPIAVTVEQMINDPASTPWEIVPGATGLTLDPGFVTTTTCYRRCVRRAGCTKYTGESNHVQIVVNPDCSAGSLPDCADISIGTAAGSINVSGLSQAPSSSVQVFSSDYSGTLFSCFDNCGGDAVSVPVAPGSYNVKVKYFNSSFVQICEVNQLVTVTMNLAAQGNFNFEVVQELEFAELIWAHNKGGQVAEYVVERSTDGTHFEAIGTQPSKGGTQTELYNSYDLAPVMGDNYYRIRINHTDGTVAYSDIRTIHYADINNFTVFPNPANGFARVSLESWVGKKDVTISVFNNLGVVVKTFHLDQVYSKFYQMDLRQLKEGHYIIWLHVPGQKPLARQLVVGKI
ncbi:MAG TPA: hypothetical protein ENJ20_01495 [Bacteroidetes bacterium]|nr:hypothetical protein [Bacteroidota bacterium]